jgi:hypothetical protein
MRAYNGLQLYFGDLHSHCSIGYGHGSVEDAFRNARLQLDFAAITAHAYWPEIPSSDRRLADLVNYHQKGFQKTAGAWPQLKAMVEANNQPGEFVTFLAFEWHSNQFGDHNIYYKSSDGEILHAENLDELREMLSKWQRNGVDVMAIPHHIGYKRGFRGINWGTFDPQFSPVVEIMSMHGASESSSAPYPYLHTMGPRDWQSTYQYGLEKGSIVGAIGSTDHHSAHPGSYGHGRLAVWSEELTRDAIWDAIQARRTYALTGDKIELSFSVNDSLIGSVLPYTEDRQFEFNVVGGAAIDYVEVLYNNRVIHRTSLCESLIKENTDPFEGPVKLHFEVGWANKGENVDWQVELQVANGELLGIEPRFRGHDVVAPQSNEEEIYAFSHWERIPDNGVQFRTRTWGNPATTTPATQGVSLSILATPDTMIRGRVNGKSIAVPITDLIRGSSAGYLGGFLTPAYTFHRMIPQVEYVCQNTFSHHSNSGKRDWYYLRVRQYNGQWAWSSPIWVETRSY